MSKRWKIEAVLVNEHGQEIDWLVTEDFPQLRGIFLQWLRKKRGQPFLVVHHRPSDRAARKVVAKSNRTVLIDVGDEFKLLGEGVAQLKQELNDEHQQSIRQLTAEM